MGEMKHWGLFFLVVFLVHENGTNLQALAGDGFIKSRGVQFMLNGRPYYANGFNAYWLMYVASDPSQRNKVTSAFEEAVSHGLTIARTWAFSDGGYQPLQISPGTYNQQMFQGLDFVIYEARRHGIKLILSLVNNYENMGGKNQYVKWARDEGHNITSDDDFFTNSAVKGFYKNHIKAWITEMASYLKSIDREHLLEVGLEGFYGESAPPNKQFNLNFQLGTDFIENNQIPTIDFVTLHSYPDQWFPGTNEESQLAFSDNWMNTHIQDAQTILRKPLLVAEFGWNNSMFDTTNTSDLLLNSVYSNIYSSARHGGAAAGDIFWQLLPQGLDSLHDGYEIILSASPSTAGMIAYQSQKLTELWF